MKFLQAADRADKISKSKQITYENVKFTGGFMSFMDTLTINKLTAGHAGTMSPNVWADYRHMGGVMVEAASNPMVYRTTVTFSGSHRALLQVKSLMEKYAEYDGKPEMGDVTVSYQYNDSLNEDIWEHADGEFVMRPEVREKLMKIAEEFYAFLKIEGVDIEDVVITGSSANYNWTENSDCDLHLIVDKKKAKKLCGKLVDEYFNTKKRVWNDLHKIRIRNFPVEIYVEGTDEKAISAGIYSVKDDEWVSKPKHEEPSVDDQAVKAKVVDLIGEIQDAISANKAAPIEALMEKIRKMRQAGLDKAGEWSTENLAFKALRNDKWLEKMHEFKTKVYDRSLSVEDEEWEHYR